MKERNTVVEKLGEVSSFLKDRSSKKYLLIKITGIIKKMKDSLNIAIAGATGYTGLELIKILSKHPKAKLLYLCATKSIGKPINKFDKRLKKYNLPKISKIDKINWSKIDILFTALPNGEAQKIAKRIPKNIKIIDLSADFRLSNFKEYEKWYGINHNCKKLIKNSIYAITEFSKKKTQGL